MNIIEAILLEKKKYIILLSGFMWWPYFNRVAKSLADNLGFELIETTVLVPHDKLISSADQINFPALNEIIKSRLEKYTEKGYVITSYTFPPEKLDFYPDIHINLNVNAMLLTSISIDFIKQKGINRMEIDNNISYLLKSWKTNKIAKTINYFPDFLEKQNDIYGTLFDFIMENIEKKLYGENFIKNKIAKENDDNQDNDNQTTKVVNYLERDIITEKVANPNKLDPDEQNEINKNVGMVNFEEDISNVGGYPFYIGNRKKLNY